jgi:hypothetical protein
MHVYLRLPPGVEIGSSVEPFAAVGLPGLDVRCDGGYVVGPGSVMGPVGAYTEEPTVGLWTPPPAELQTWH